MVGSPSRTPPLLLVALLLVMGILGYSYWSAKSENANLTAELETVRYQKREVDQRQSQSERKLVNTKTLLFEAQGQLRKANDNLRLKETQISSMKSDLGEKQADFEKLRSQWSKCDSNLGEMKNELENEKEQNEKLEKQLQEEKARQVTCDMNSCKHVIREILAVFGKLVGSDALAKGLTNANLDAKVLMEGINFPAPTQQQGQNRQLNSQNKQEQHSNQKQQPTNQTADQKLVNQQQQPVNQQQQPVNQQEPVNMKHTEDQAVNSSIVKNKGNLNDGVRNLSSDKNLNESEEFNETERVENISKISKQNVETKSMQTGEKHVVNKDSMEIKEVKNITTIEPDNDDETGKKNAKGKKIDDFNDEENKDDMGRFQRRIVRRQKQPVQLN